MMVQEKLGLVVEYPVLGIRLEPEAPVEAAPAPVVEAPAAAAEETAAE